MPIVKWDPFGNVNTLQERINRMFDETFPRSDEDEALSVCDWKPAVDIYQTDEGLVIMVDLPGVSKEDVTVQVKNNLLTLRGDRRFPQNVDESRYFRKERCCGTFQRAFNLKSTVLPEKIKAKFKEGVLTIEILRPDEEKPRQIKVNVE